MDEEYDIPDELKELMDDDVMDNVVEDVNIEQDKFDTNNLSEMIKNLQNMSPQQRNNLLSSLTNGMNINPNNNTYQNLSRDQIIKTRLRKKLEERNKKKEEDQDEDKEEIVISKKTIKNRRRRKRRKKKKDNKIKE